jgi:hypothetical protein
MLIQFIVSLKPDNLTQSRWIAPTIKRNTIAPTDFLFKMHLVPQQKNQMTRPPMKRTKTPKNI